MKGDLFLLTTGSLGEPVLVVAVKNNVGIVSLHCLFPGKFMSFGFHETRYKCPVSGSSQDFVPTIIGITQMSFRNVRPGPCT